MKGIVNISTSFLPDPVYDTMVPAKVEMGSEVNVSPAANSAALLKMEFVDFEGGSGNPQVSFELYDGSSPSIVIDHDDEESAVVAIQNVDGLANAFATLRAVHVRAVPTNPDLPSKLRLRMTMGAPGDWSHVVLPAAWDSTEPDRSAESIAAVAVPLGLPYDNSYPMAFEVYECQNATVLVTVCGD